MGSMGEETGVVRKAIVFDSKDNVATAIVRLESESSVSVKVNEESVEVGLKDSIPFGHKFAIKLIAEGEEVIKYGEIIGRATAIIAVGEHAHVHNVESLRGRGDIKEA